MKKTTFLILFWIVSLISNAQTYTINQTVRPENNIKIEKSTINETIIDVSINTYSLKAVNTPKGEEYILQAKGAFPIQAKSYPDIAKYTKTLQIPADKKMKIQIIEASYTDINNISIAPSKGAVPRNISPNNVPYEYSDIYNQNTFFPNKIAELSQAFILRNVRGITVKIQPFQYNALNKTLRIYTHYKIRVYHDNEQDNINTLAETKSVTQFQEDFIKIYNSVFDNFKSANNLKYTVIPEGQPGRMLIISYGDFMDEMQDFVNWKNQKGIFTEMVDVSTIGNNPTDIKNYIQSYYSNHPDLSYVLLVGDNAQVATSSTGAGDSDNNYGYLAGNDHRIDVFIGRFSAETPAQVTTQVQRTIHYEKDITASETWMQYGLGIASNEGGSGGDDSESDIQHIGNINTDLTNYGYLDVTHVYQGQQTATDISNAINAHTGVINYCGHGDVDMWYSVDPSYTNTYVNQLTNTNHLPFIFSVACVVGNFKTNTCFSETWQRATDSNGDPTGAIANIGSTINQSWASPMCAQDEMVDILVESYNNNIKRTFGGVVANGWGQMIDEYGNDGENMADTWTVFGDASVMLRTKQPAEMNISHASGINIGATSFSLNCDEENALACVTQNNQILGFAYISGGQATINFSSGVQSTGQVLLTVTAYNKVTYQQELPIIASTNPPVCDFQADNTNIVEGQTVNFTDLSTEYPSSWSWTFDGGTPATSTDQNPQVTYFTAGTYTVSLYVENPNGNDTETKTAYITVSENTTPPVADFSASQTDIQVGESVNFTDLSQNYPTSWSWEFEGGTPNTSTEQNPQNIVYNTAGTYQVRLVATNAAGNDVEVKTAYITVNLDYCDAGATNSTAYEYINDVICGDINNTGTGLSSNGYADYSNLSTDVSLNQDVTLSVNIGSVYNTDKLYVWADWNLDGDFDDAGEQVYVSSQQGVANQTINFTVPANASSGNVRLRIRLNDTQNGSLETPCGTSGYGEVEDYTLHVTGTSQETAPIADFIASQTDIQVGESVNFTDLSQNNPTSWSWTFEGGTPNTSTEQNPQNITYNSAGTYTVTLLATNSAGSDTETKTAYINVSNITGVQKTETNLILSLYPNPASNNVNIQFESKQNQAYKLVLTDVAGKTLLQENIPCSKTFNIQINLNNYEKGMYYIKIYNENTLLNAQKLIKK